VRRPKLKTIGYTKVSGSYLTVVPEDVRAILKCEVGDRLVWYEHNGEVIIKKA